MTEPASQETIVETPPPEEVREEVREPLRDAPPAPGPYEAAAGTYFRNVRYGLFLLIFGYGLWSLYDGFVVWPNDTRQYDALAGQIRQADERQDKEEVARLTALQEQHPHHDAAGILFNRILGLALPPVAALLLARWLYISRGRVRLDGQDTLHVPGEEPIPADAITEIDDTRWDRKGMSYVRFERGGEEGRVKLDDFVYDGRPVKHIHDRLVYLLESRGGEPAPIDAPPASVSAAAGSPGD